MYFQFSCSHVNISWEFGISIFIYHISLRSSMKKFFLKNTYLKLGGLNSFLQRGRDSQLRLSISQTLLPGPYTSPSINKNTNPAVANLRFLSQPRNYRRIGKENEIWNVETTWTLGETKLEIWLLSSATNFHWYFIPTLATIIASRCFSEWPDWINIFKQLANL